MDIHFEVWERLHLFIYLFNFTDHVVFGYIYFNT